MPPFVNPIDTGWLVALEGTVIVDGPFLAGAAYLAAGPPLSFGNSSQKEFTENFNVAVHTRAQAGQRVVRLDSATVEHVNLVQDCCRLLK